MTPPLYVPILGQAFSELPLAVQRLHIVGQPSRWHGRAGIERGSHPACRLIASLLRMPPEASDIPLTVAFTPDGEGEIWKRSFGNHEFMSRQAPGKPGCISEAIGPMTVTLRPSVSGNALALDATALHCAGLPMPGLLIPRISTREWEDAGRYHFSVDARLAGLGRLIAYRGWLEPASP